MFKFLSYFLSLFLIGCSSLGSPKKVLVIISSESQLILKNGEKYPTGYYFNELIVPSMKLVELGYEVVISNPRGSNPDMDKRSLSSKYFRTDAEFQAAKKFHDKFDVLFKPRSFRSIIDSGLGQFSALYIPGGHAPMIDLVDNIDLATILDHFHSKKKPTALLCHGPVALLSAMDNSKKFNKNIEEENFDRARVNAKSWPYRGYKMTAFSTKEEHAAEESLGGSPKFYIENALKIAGANLEIAPMWQSHVVVDRELITGQNPASDMKLTERLIEALQKK